MTQERIEQLADAYAAGFEPMFRKAARRAYIDGLQHYAEFVALLKEYKAARDKFNELCKGPSGGMSQFWREDAGFEMDRKEKVVKDYVKKMEE